MQISSDGERLNKFLAYQLGMSRREADELIEKGSVLINGEIAILGQRFKQGDSITVGGKPVTITTGFRYIALHKPVDYVCSRRAQDETPTVYELLPKEYHDLKLVGRLDKNSSGIILLTNDGDFAHHMTHPSFHKTKIYEVGLDQPLQPLHRQMISDHGISLEDGVSKFELARLTDGDETAWQITMHEGRNRQIRRTFAALGYDVTKLHRTQFGPFALEDLAPAQWREVDQSSRNIPQISPQQDQA